VLHIYIYIYIYIYDISHLRVKCKTQVSKSQQNAIVYPKELHHTFSHLLTLLLVTCFGLFSVIIKAIFHTQRWVLLLILHLYLT